ncbi:MAG: acetyltransferase [Candidatus Electryonea clarkiae]|nr:acetyltransferase [Candidatus Electryonea clarkiae]MDP8285062.1 acetyltransferase [Candidatus Electryonea clarkiae]
MHDIVIIGGGGHAKVIISILLKNRNYRIIGYTDLYNNGDILNIQYIGNDDVLRQVIIDNPSTSATIGLGMIKTSDAQKRKQVFELIRSLGFELSPVLSLNAIIDSDVSMGEATVAMSGVVVNCGTTIGKSVILNTNCSIDHDCNIGDFTHIAPGVTISGGVTVGENVLIGVGSVVIEYKAIADNVIIGAGAVVTRDIIEAGVYAGIPAKRIK